MHMISKICTILYKTIYEFKFDQFINVLYHSMFSRLMQYDDTICIKFWLPLDWTGLPVDWTGLNLKVRAALY